MNATELTLLDELEEASRSLRSLATPFLDSLVIEPQPSRRSRGRGLKRAGPPQLPTTSSASAAHPLRRPATALDQRLQLLDQLLSLTAFAAANKLLWPGHHSDADKDHDDTDIDEGTVDLSLGAAEALRRMPREEAHPPPLDEHWYRCTVRSRLREHTSAARSARFLNFPEDSASAPNRDSATSRDYVSFAPPSLLLDEQQQKQPALATTMTSAKTTMRNVPRPTVMRKDPRKLRRASSVAQQLAAGITVKLQASAEKKRPRGTQEEEAAAEAEEDKQQQGKVRRTKQRKFATQTKADEAGVYETLRVLLQVCRQSAIASTEQAAATAQDTTEPIVDLTTLPAPLMCHAQGARWLVAMHSQPRGCVLADAAGLGQKTQVGVFLRSLARDRGAWGPHMVVARAGTLREWKAAIEAAAPELLVLPYWGSPRRRSLVRKLWGSVGMQAARESEFHVVVATPESLREDAQLVAELLSLDVLVVDGATQLLPSSLPLPSNSLRLLVSELQPLCESLPTAVAALQFLFPGAVSATAPQWYGSDIGELLQSVSLTHEESTALAAIFQPVALSRHRETVLPELPPLTESLVRCKLSAVQAARYTQLVANGSPLAAVHAVLDGAAPAMTGRTPFVFMARPSEVAVVAESPLQVTIPKLLFRHMPPYFPCAYRCPSIREQLLQWLFNLFTTNYIIDSLRPNADSDSTTDAQPESTCFSFTRFCSMSPSDVAFLSRADAFDILHSDFDCTLANTLDRHQLIEPSSQVRNRTLLLLPSLNNELLVSGGRSVIFESIYNSMVFALPGFCCRAVACTPTLYCSDRSALHNNEFSLADQLAALGLAEPPTFALRPRMMERPGSGKLSQLGLILRELRKARKRVLVCVSELATADAVAAMLSRHGYPFVTADASAAAQCSEASQLFCAPAGALATEGVPFVFLLQVPLVSSQQPWSWASDAGVLGNAVVLYDSGWLPPAVEARIISLCQRVGNSGTEVTVYRLITADTIEEHPFSARTENYYDTRFQ